MINFKWGIIFALIALVVSVVLGIISGVNALHIILRSFIFMLLFFGLGIGIYVVIDNFFPELLFDDEDTSAQINFDQPGMGTKVNITLGGMGDYAIPEKAENSGEQELGNIEDLISGAFRPKSQSRPETGSSGIDRSRESVYNEPGSDLFDDDNSGFTFQEPAQPQEHASAPIQRPVFTPSLGDDSADGLGGLPDLDSMAMAFSGAMGGEAPAAGSAFADPEPAAASSAFDESESMQYNKGNKAQPLEGDFDPKSLAEGIRTVLARDK